MQYERDVIASLDSLGELVRAHGLSWEEDAFYEIGLIVRAALEAGIEVS
jgi:hypothetical protein